MLAIFLLSVSIICYSSSLEVTRDVLPEINVLSTTTPCDGNCFEITSTSTWNYGDLNDLHKNVSLINSAEKDNFNPTIKCLPGQSAYIEHDLKVIINEVIFKSQTLNKITDSYYVRANNLRDIYEQCINEIEQRFEDRPNHLKHIMEEIVKMRRRIEPVAKHIYTKLKIYDSHEKNFNETQIKVNKLMQNLQKTWEICKLNCEHNESNKEAVRSRRYFDDSVYCSTYKELVDIIKDRLNLFQTGFTAEMIENIKTDSNVFRDKIVMIRNKMKETGIKYFGITFFEILNLQDEYYHLWEDLKQSNVTKYLDEIKMNNYEINSQLVELENLDIRAREYCSHCNDDKLQFDEKFISSVKFTSKLWNMENRNRLPEITRLGTKTILDRVLDDMIMYHKNQLVKEYTNTFQNLKKKLDDRNIIAKYISKVKPLRDDVINEIKKETKQLEDIQNLAPKTARDNVTKLFLLSKEIMEIVKCTIIAIKDFLILN